MRKFRNAFCRSRHAVASSRERRPGTEFVSARNHPHAATGCSRVAQLRAGSHGPLPDSASVSRGEAAHLSKPQVRRCGGDPPWRRASRTDCQADHFFHQRSNGRLVFRWCSDFPSRHGLRRPQPRQFAARSSQCGKCDGRDGRLSCAGRVDRCDARSIAGLPAATAPLRICPHARWCRIPQRLEGHQPPRA